jgi:hypothetical protein
MGKAAYTAGGAATGIPVPPMWNSSSSTNKKILLQNAGIAQGNANQLYGQGQGVGSFITPQLESEAVNPEGYTPQQLAYMNTAGQQSVGGSTSGITGTANLEAARTRNAGGFQGAIGSGSRAASKNLSQLALQTQMGQAQLQQQQKQQALQALQSLYGTDISDSLGYLNSSDTAINERMGKGSGTGSAAIGAAGTIGAAALAAL